MVWENLFEELQDGCHCEHVGYRNRMIFLQFRISMMLHIKFRSGRDVEANDGWMDDGLQAIP